MPCILSLLADAECPPAEMRHVAPDGIVSSGVCLWEMRRMSARPDISAVNNLLAERLPDLARELVGVAPINCCRQDLRFRSRGSLSVCIAGPKRGSWFDHEAGRGGDPLGLIAHLRRMTMRDAYAWALDWLREGSGGVDRGARNPPVVGCQAASHAVLDQGSRKAWSAEMARAVWHQAERPESTPVETYLASRGLQMHATAALRFHPRVWRNRANGPLGPAMVALMTNPKTGMACGTHVTYLRNDGLGKAGGDRPKIMLGTAGVIRLAPDAAVTRTLGLAEGIETALAVMQRAGWSPVWTATSAGAIDRFPVLPGIEMLTVFADADAAGISAARDCCRRWAGSGRNARILRPPAGDWDDVLPRAGRST